MILFTSNYLISQVFVYVLITVLMYFYSVSLAIFIENTLMPKPISMFFVYHALEVKGFFP